MSAHELIDRVVLFVEDLNRGDLATIQRNIAADYFGSEPARDEPDAVATHTMVMTDLRSAVPDLQIALDQLQEADGDVTGRARFTGTHQHALWGSPGSGKRFDWEVAVTIRPKGDRFAIRFDDTRAKEAVAVLRQFGLVNPPDQMDLPHPYPVAVPEFVLRVVFTGQAGDKPCSHLDQIAVIDPTTDVCRQCVELDSVWPALRMCLICGFVGCCDTSRYRHMRAHARETGHPLFRSIRMDEGWFWCYEDAAFFPKRSLERYR